LPTTQRSTLRTTQKPVPASAGTGTGQPKLRGMLINSYYGQQILDLEHDPHTSTIHVDNMIAAYCQVAMIGDKAYMRKDKISKKSYFNPVLLFSYCS
jgi:hypothetical protein